METVEESPVLLLSVFDIFKYQLNRQLKKIGLLLLEPNELITELLDLGFEPLCSSLFLSLASLELSFDCLSLSSGLIEKGLKLSDFNLSLGQTLLLADGLSETFSY